MDNLRDSIKEGRLFRVVSIGPNPTRLTIRGWDEFYL